VSKRVITYEAECYICDRGTLFTEDLDQQPERLGDSETMEAKVFESELAMQEIPSKFFASHFR